MSATTVCSCHGAAREVTGSRHRIQCSDGSLCHQAIASLGFGLSVSKDFYDSARLRADSSGGVTVES